MTKKTLKLNKESLVVLNEKEMSQINGGVAFLSLWGSNCYQTDPGRHKCCQPGTATDPNCEQWSMEPPCDEFAYGDAHFDSKGVLQYLDDNGLEIHVADFNPDTAVYFLVK